ncbi:DUF6364 family protein [Nocardia sp. NPDC049149]|uniref:DUF6364 family protein n=1 Tax=Nocardia sp. NPDC049149 TaxID=3364315 RepID=UPI003719E5B2
MAKRNITIQLDEDVITDAKVIAAKRGTSVSALIAQQLVELSYDDMRYERAKRLALQLMAEAEPHGGRRWSRADIYKD